MFISRYGILGSRPLPPLPTLQRARPKESADGASARRRDQHEAKELLEAWSLRFAMFADIRHVPVMGVLMKVLSGTTFQSDVFQGFGVSSRIPDKVRPKTPGSPKPNAPHTSRNLPYMT